MTGGTTVFALKRTTERMEEEYEIAKRVHAALIRKTREWGVARTAKQGFGDS
jgi:hypothetical protein